MTFTDDPVARSIREVYPYQVDLENCAKEPIHHIQVVQGHACLVAVDLETFLVRYVSDNLYDFVGIRWESIMDKHLSTVFGVEVTGQIPLGLAREDGFEGVNPVQAFFTVNGEMMLRNVIIHRSADCLILEVEKASQLLQTATYQQTLARAIRRIQNITSWDRLFSETAGIIKQLTGYDRVMVYKFDRDYHGTVIAEARNAHLESFEGLRYPHTDIPRQARELYLTNRVRLISGVSDVPSRIQISESVDGGTFLDLTHATGRGVSPVHLEYLGYMGVNNSLSVAIIMEGKLWGLFALHHYSPRTIDYGTRNVLQFIGQIFSGHLALHAASRYQEQVLERNLVRLSIGEHITNTHDIFEGLTTGEDNLLNLFGGVVGAAICFEGRFELYGDCPPKEDVTELMDNVNKQAHHEHQLHFASDSIAKSFPQFEQHCDNAAGVLAIYLNPSYQDWICWFRPGISKEISWGGDPQRTMVVSGPDTRRMGPRQSFARYIETVEGCSAEWADNDIETALALRITVINSMLQRYVEVREINERLQKAYEDLETFSYTVSHDLRAPLRAINGYAEILEEDYQDQLDEEAGELIAGIQRGVTQMNNFITDILELSRVGSKGLETTLVELNPLLKEILHEVRGGSPGKSEISITVDPNLPSLQGDTRLLRQLYVNLLHNAVKYAQPDDEGQVSIEVGARQEPRMNKIVYTVSNTGPAIPDEYKRTVFEMFTRLSSSHDQEEGSGVGLAIVERIVHRHNGKIWITDDLKGVTFNFFFDVENS